MQDHMILNAVSRKDGIMLKPLLLYVITHELIHVIRFFQNVLDYHADQGRYKQEEKNVHGITYRLLKDLPYDGLNVVMNAYRWARA